MDAASDKGSSTRTRRRIRSIEVGFRVIRALLAAQRPSPLRDIAAAAGMTPSKAHLYLASLVREGMAFQDPETGHYGLGPFAARLGLSAIRQLSIVDEARPYLRQLSERTGCAAYLSILGETGPAIVSKSDGIRSGALSVQLGYVLPLTSSATGQLLLAYHAPAQRAALLDREYTHTTRNPESHIPREKLEATLAKVRKQGYATTSGQINANFVAAAAPVFDHYGEVTAALTVLGPDRYLTSNRLKACVTDLLQMAAGLSRAIGAPDSHTIPPSKKPSRPT
jgi:DNA-binding IclR family transcriptional regulator